ncbi:MAG TPA: NAD(P)H-binding protein [Pseudolabrys sp.]|nr:NAD(P)H-binding protein [Pseudolabrys sp.]
MRIVVIGGHGFIGTRLVSILRANGHDVIAASRSYGVDAVTGEGVSEAVAGAQVVVDVAESPLIDDPAVHEFFVKESRNVLGAEKVARVRHHVALSLVGVDRVRDSPYFYAKAAQEVLIAGSSIPYTIVRSTQFFEFMERIIQLAADGDAIRVPPALIQPVAPDDVAEVLAEIAVASPLNGTIELAGPERICLNELARLILSAHEDPRDIIADPGANFFGARLDPQSLIPGANPRIGPSTVRDWLRQFMTAD